MISLLPSLSLFHLCFLFSAISIPSSPFLFLSARLRFFFSFSSPLKLCHRPLSSLLTSEGRLNFIPDPFLVFHFRNLISFLNIVLKRHRKVFPTLVSYVSVNISYAHFYTLVTTSCLNERAKRTLCICFLREANFFILQRSTSLYSTFFNRWSTFPR